MKGIGDYKDLSHPHIASVFTFHIVCGFVKNSLHIQPVKILNKNTADNPKDYLPYLYTPVLFKLNFGNYMLWFVNPLKRVICIFSLLIPVIF